MLLPRWIPFLVAAWVIAFGILRLRLATRKEDPNPKRPNYRKGGYYGRSKRSHFVFGVAYLLLGAACVAMGFGYTVDLSGGCLSQRDKQETIQGNPGTVPVEVR